MTMAPVDELHKYGFKLIGNFWELYRRDIPEEPGLYAFVACGPIKSVDWEISKIIGLNHTYNIFHRKGFIDDCDALTNDILYIGRAQKTNLRIRLDNYRSKGKKGLPYTTPNDYREHGGTWILKSAWTQGVSVDVFVKCIPDVLIEIDGVPLDRLVGMEAALIRRLRPRPWKNASYEVSEAL